MRIVNTPPVALESQRDSRRAEVSPKNQSTDAPSSAVVDIHTPDQTSSMKLADSIRSERVDEIRVMINSNDYLLDFAKLAEELLGDEIGRG